MILEDRRAIRRPHTGHVVEVFDRDRQTTQPAGFIRGGWMPFRHQRRFACSRARSKQSVGSALTWGSTSAMRDSAARRSTPAGRFHRHATGRRPRSRTYGSDHLATSSPVECVNACAMPPRRASRGACIPTTVFFLVRFYSHRAAAPPSARILPPLAGVAPSRGSAGQTATANKPNGRGADRSQLVDVIQRPDADRARTTGRQRKLRREDRRRPDRGIACSIRQRDGRGSAEHKRQRIVYAPEGLQCRRVRECAQSAWRIRYFRQHRGGSLRTRSMRSTRFRPASTRRGELDLWGKIRRSVGIGRRHHRGIRGSAARRTC